MLKFCASILQPRSKMLKQFQMCMNVWYEVFKFPTPHYSLSCHLVVLLQF